MIGGVLTALFAKIDGISYVLLGGLVPLSCGIGLLFYYAISAKFSKRKNSDD